MRISTLFENLSFIMDARAFTFLFGAFFVYHPFCQTS